MNYQPRSSAVIIDNAMIIVLVVRDTAVCLLAFEPRPLLNTNMVSVILLDLKQMGNFNRKLFCARNSTILQIIQLGVIILIIDACHDQIFMYNLQ